MAERYYPVGIQTFSEIIRGGYVYVDKTDLMWRMQNKRKYIFLARPRRFGKSLLSSTIHSFFAGERELFEGLKVMELEREWHTYPVIHLDLSVAKGLMSVDELRKKLRFIMKPYAELYGTSPDEDTPGGLLTGIVSRAKAQTGKPVVVVIDEYDAPLLDVLHEDLLNDFRKVMQEFYIPLKMLDPLLKFCFITGITKFSQLSIFSTINNLTNISMWPEFSGICGITENELVTTLGEDIRLMAKANECTPEEIHSQLKTQYDGYRFSEHSEEIYNPFSLLKAFDSKKISNYWFDSGTPTFLIHQLKHFQTNIMSFDSLEAPATAFDQPTENMKDALPLLYQSGYLTIKDYDRAVDTYTLALPNQEVRVGYTRGLLPAYVGLDGNQVQVGFAAKFWLALKRGDIDQAMHEMQVFLSGVPYVEGFKQKLREAAAKEGFWEYTLYLIFSMLNVYARTQVKCLGGRTDMVVWMPDTTYVFELKVNGTAQDALEQIDKRGYAIPYLSDGRRVVKVGVKCNADTRMVEEWATRA